MSDDHVHIWRLAAVLTGEEPVIAICEECDATLSYEQACRRLMLGDAILAARDEEQDEPSP